MTANIQHFAVAEDNLVFAKVLAGADTVIVPDGWPVVRAQQFLRRHRSDRITGSDLLPKLIDGAAKLDLAVGFVGGGPGVAELAAARATSEGARVVLASGQAVDSPPSVVDRQRLLAASATTSPDLLFLCIGTPKSELLGQLVLTEVNAGAIMCFGAGLDFYAGKKRRAPVALQRLGLEWLYRLVREPGRLFPRYARAAPGFVRAVMAERERLRRSRNG